MSAEPSSTTALQSAICSCVSRTDIKTAFHSRASMSSICLARALTMTNPRQTRSAVSTLRRGKRRPPPGTTKQPAAYAQYTYRALWWGAATASNIDCSRPGQLTVHDNYQQKHTQRT
ncbi:hypothetical protein POSPLADRAFT_1049437 [Postia placenta MAD-698-R-SB12]|uniref:Uncharacterized protein n=1 Tax=Postia placenta MAD-698-R-SB12 TaxID=670580 RepID=A0A1X6MP43_9APHY|nr:hypothetical protein POSPLADRAFT_1049437 [Postia placenta MAD-698-R-SB12]OSX58191.1 hypothetical protein POSPLADRAFT_1049437 [Postia placenta MAD-698-R-SB12]